MPRAALLFAALLLPQAALAEPRWRTLTVEEVATRVAHHAIQVFDCDPRTMFLEGHLPGARWVDPDAIETALPADPEAPIVFYCANEQCLGSHRAAEHATERGHHHVFVMPAGIRGWERAGHRIEK